MYYPSLKWLTVFSLSRLYRRHGGARLGSGGFFRHRWRLSMPTRFPWLWPWQAHGKRGRFWQMIGTADRSIRFGWKSLDDTPLKMYLRPPLIQLKQGDLRSPDHKRSPGSSIAVRTLIYTLYLVLVVVTCAPSSEAPPLCRLRGGGRPGAAFVDEFRGNSQDNWSKKVGCFWSFVWL